MDTIIPDLDSKAFKVVRKIVKSRPKSEAEKRESALASNVGYIGWEKGLKPYIEKRIESLEKMLEVDLDGKETVGEIGFRYLICSSIAKELQDIINRVVLLNRVIEKKKAKAKALKKKKKK